VEGRYPILTVFESPSVVKVAPKGLKGKSSVSMEATAITFFPEEPEEP
jgi:hypothetical protein